MSLSAGRPSKTKTPATLADMADAPPTVRVNFDLARADHSKLKIHAIATGKTVRQVLTDFVATLPNQQG